MAFLINFVENEATVLLHQCTFVIKLFFWHVTICSCFIEIKVFLVNWMCRYIRNCDIQERSSNSKVPKSAFRLQRWTNFRTRKSVVTKVSIFRYRSRLNIGSPTLLTRRHRRASVPLAQSHLPSQQLYTQQVSAYNQNHPLLIKAVCEFRNMPPNCSAMSKRIVSSGMSCLRSSYVNITFVLKFQISNILCARIWNGRLFWSKRITFAECIQHSCPYNNRVSLLKISPYRMFAISILEFVSIPFVRYVAS